MQLSKIGQIESKKFDFIDPYTNEKTGITATIYPKNSKHGANAEHQMRFKIATLIADEQNIIVDGENKTLKPNLIMQVGLEMLADMITDWSGITDEEGNELPYTKENAIKAFQECQEFADFIANTSMNFGNFQKAKKKS